MKINVIRLDRIDELLHDYKTFKNKGESFSEFIEVSKGIEENKKLVFDFEEVEEKNLIEVIE